LFFVLAATAFLGSSLSGVVLVLGLLYWVSFARIVRGEVMVLRDREFVRCARGLGVGPFGIITRHLLPNVKGPILVNAAFVAASSIIVEATLSFLGLGPGDTTVSWGKILMQGKQYSHLSAWHLWLFPGLTMVLLLFCLHYLADRIRQGNRSVAG
jgi:peptide/nickel transport system permease protein